MKNYYIGKLALIVLLFSHCLGLQAQGLTQVQLPNTTASSNFSPEEKAFHDDKLFVKFRQPETGLALEFKGKSERSQKLKQDKISKALLKADARLMRQAAGKGFGREVSKIFQVEADGSKAAVQQLLDELKAMPEVEYAERVPIYTIHTAPNDPRYTANQQYSLNITKAVLAYSSFNSSNAPAKVAIIDDAVLISHNDLQANIWTNPGETGVDANGNDKATNGIDDDNNGYIDDVNGWDAADRDNNPNPPLVPTARGNLASPDNFSHGTHCAGIAGAVTGNGVGVASVSNNKIQIVPVKCTYDDAANMRSIYTSFDGLVYALRGAKANVVSMSFGGSSYSQAFQDLINEGAAMGVVFIASAGNNNNDIEQYPAAYAHVISVSNTDASDKKSSSSTFGNWVTIAAPGASIMSTVPGTGTEIATGAYAYKSGTSMSGPMVAGLAGFLKAQNPSLTPAQVKQIIVSTSDNVDLMNSGYEGLLGAGRINAYHAMLAAGGTALPPTADFVLNKTNIIVGEEVTFVNRSTGSNLSYAWTFANASSATSTLKDPKVKFTSAGLHTVSLTVNGSITKTIQVNVSGTTPIDILGLPLSTAVGASGVNGHSVNNIPAFANAYKYATTHLVAGVNISFRLATAGSPGSTIRVKVWNSEKGVPGQVLHTQTVKISDLKANGLAGTMSPNYFYFDKPVQVPANNAFFVGFEIDYGTGDNISIHHFASSGADALLFFNNSWQINGQLGLGWTFAIFPIIAEAAAYPSGNIAVSATEACLGATVQFNASGVSGAGTYQWNFGNGVTSTDAVASTTYTAAGTYQPTLIAAKPVTITKGANSYPVELRNTFTKQLRAADCGTAPVASFESSALTGNVGSSLKFINKAKDATSYEWLFVSGNTKIKSTEENPVITFTTKGRYDVTLTARNPNGQVAQAYKRQYIEIFTAGQNCNTVDYPFPTRLTAIGTAAGGTFSGHNGYGIKDFAKAFDLGAGKVVTKAFLNILSASATAPAESFITVKVWDATGPNGAPGQVLSATQVSYAKLQQAISNTKGDLDVVLGQAVIVPADGRIYVGFSINNTGKDNLIVSTKVSGPDMGDRSLFYYGSWLSYKSIGVQTDYAIGVATFDNADQLPIADFTVSASKVGVGEAIILDASKTKKAQVYNWEASGGTISMESGIAPAAVYFPTKASVVFDAPGIYTITLYATGDCDAKVSTKTIQVEVTAGTSGTTATAAKAQAQKEIALAGEDVVYPNPSSGTFNLVVKGQAQQQVSVSIWNITGKQLEHKDLLLQSDNEVHQIDLSKQPAGLYLIKVTNGNRTQTHKVIKQ